MFSLRSIALATTAAAALVPAAASAKTYCVFDQDCTGTPVWSIQDAIDAALTAHGFQHGVGGSFRRLEVHGESAIAPRVFKLMTPVGDEDELDAELARGIIEASRLIA